MAAEERPDPQVMHGPKPRPRRRPLTVLAAAVAIGVAVPLALVITHGSSTAAGAGHQDLSQLAGPSAPRLAGGRWEPIATAPFPLCAPAAAWDGTGLVVVDGIQPAQRSLTDCGIARETGAGIYNPRTDRWTGIAPPPATLGRSLLVAWSAGRLVAVSTENGSAAAWSRTRDAWTALPDRPDPTFTATSVAAIGSRVVVTTVGKDGPGGADLLVGDTWQLLPALPADGQHVAAAAVADLGGTLYAMTTTEPAAVTLDSQFYDRVASHLTALDGDHWRPVSSETDVVSDSTVPLSGLALTAVDGHLLATGRPCPPGIACTLPAAIATLVQPGQSPPLYRVVAETNGFAVTGGGTTVVYQSIRSTDGTLVPPPLKAPGRTTVFDISTGHHLVGPSAGGGAASLLTAWTPDGPVCLGEADNGGLILRPAG